MSAHPSCLVVLFGATGDLARRKLLPALYHLIEQEHVETLHVLGVARSPYDDATFRTEVEAALEEHVEAVEDSQRWCRTCLHYQSVQGDGSEFVQLKERIEALEHEHDLGGNRMFYLSLPPTVFPSVVEALGEHGLTDSTGWTRLVLEKPFGHDLTSAEKLNADIHRHFDESQVYRIDHYLGKETVRNLLVFRFANALFESVWNRDRIERVEIQVKESIGVGSRAGYYDKSGGALRDMIQNHLTQLLTLVAMEPPSTFSSNAIRREKLKVLESLRPPDPDAVVLGQYAAGTVNGEAVPGYHDESDIPDDSKTETYAAVTLHVNNWRWQGVPFVLRTGKRLPRRVTRILVHFRRVPVTIFDTMPEDCELESNTLVITLQPDEGFDLYYQVKKPGETLSLVTEKLGFRYSDAFDARLSGAYETLLLDVMQGDQTLFVHADEAEAAWRLYTPLLEADLPVHAYPAGSEGPA